MKAVQAAFVEIKTPKFTKKVCPLSIGINSGLIFFQEVREIPKFQRQYTSDSDWLEY